MTDHLAGASISSRSPSRRREPRPLCPCQPLGGALVAGLIALIIQGATMPARGADDPPPGEKAAARLAFVVEFRRTLKSEQMRLIALADQVLGDPAALGDQLDRTRIETIRAEGEARSAALGREVAELALKEYAEALLPQEIAANDGELSVARASLVRARELAKEASGQSAEGH